MKKICTTLFLLCGIYYAAEAQNWVDTMAKNKNVVLEEYTGIHCTYCPDGHKRANNLADDNPGRVFLINIHTGSYANPGAGELDMRTTEGDEIATKAGITGYPTGSVNRSKTPWTESRANWATTAGTVLSQASPVNAYVKSYFDRTTRELTTEVEVYFTGTPSGDYKLNVALTQDYILGTQTGGTTFYPENFINGQYVHNHVFRMMLTPGAWGETLTAPSKGDYIYKKYVTVLPESQKGIPLTFYNLNVVAFVTQSNNSNILTGHGAEVDYDHSGTVDLSLTNATQLPSGLCVAPFKPKVEVTNNSQDTVASFTLSMKLGNQTFTKNYMGGMTPGEKTTVMFDNLIQPRGEFSIDISGFGQINGGSLFDVNLVNDKTSLSGLGFASDAFTYGKFGFNGSMDANTGRIMDQNPQFTPITTGGFAGGAVRFSIHSSWGMAGKPGGIALGEADFSNVTDPELSYYYAYSDGGQGGTAPSITVKVSEDCGATFTQVNAITCQSTGEPPNPQYFYVPKTSEYIQQVVDLSAYAGKSVIIVVSGVPGTSGNALYIDEIELGSSAKMASVSELEKLGVSVYPNPSNGILNVQLDNAKNGEAELCDLSGKVLARLSILNGTAQFDTAPIANGIYLVRVSSDSLNTTVKVNVAH